jgi:hypothetical protein
MEDIRHDIVNRQQLVFFLRQTIEIVEKNKFRVRKLHKNREFQRRTVKIEQVAKLLVESNLFSSMDVVNFTLVSRRKIVSFLGLEIFVSHMFTYIIFVALISIYGIADYISTPGLKYGRSQFNFLSNVVIICTIIICAVLIYFFIQHKLLFRSVKGKGAMVYSINSYLRFLLKINTRIENISTKEISKILKRLKQEPR